MQFYLLIILFLKHCTAFHLSVMLTGLILCKKNILFI